MAVGSPSVSSIGPKYSNIPTQCNHKYHSEPKLCTRVYSANIPAHSECFQTLPMANSSQINSTILDEFVDFVVEFVLQLMRWCCIGWFTGLSKRFLVARTARLLILAGTDRLDRELMIGQMQGKFQMEVVPDVGHMLHEVRV